MTRSDVTQASSSSQKRCSSSSSSSAKAAASAAAATQNFRVASPKEAIPKDYLKEHYASISKKAQQKQSQDRDFYVSVLESSSATKRDAKQYLQTFGPTVPKGPPASAIDPLTHGARAISETPRFVQLGGASSSSVAAAAPSAASAATSQQQQQPHVAVVKFRRPQDVDEATLRGVAKTLAQLRALGLLSVVVLDCEVRPGDKQWARALNQQAYRLAGAIDEYGEPWTTIVDSALSSTRAHDTTAGGGAAGEEAAAQVRVEDGDALLTPLGKGAAVIVPPVVQHVETAKAQPVDANEAVLCITRYLTGLQFSSAPPTATDGSNDTAAAVAAPAKKALVDRVIILDPVGGIPAKNRWNNAHVFLNLEDELESAKAHLKAMASSSSSSSPHETTRAAATTTTTTTAAEPHLANIDLARRTLAILPSSSSALITTPGEAANLPPPSPVEGEEGHHAAAAAAAANPLSSGFVGTVGTRRSHNPLIHNLLTDRPAHSSSLPLGRIKPVLRMRTTAAADDPAALLHPVLSPTTLAKRGMPVTLYPDPTDSGGWAPPRPGAPRLKLTDTCVDLPRLVHLINDSFSRRLDVAHYLARVEQSLAGIIVAGQYEGGAILTWERPFGLDERAAYESGRLVPYLDKFAVLKKSQGAGGVADIVFNAMVRGAFPDGVCWRSRKNNPVNKWYFERSRGTMKLPGSQWSMFWTTPGVMLQDQRFRDYEDVCRRIEPSWADNKHIVD